MRHFLAYETAELPFVLFEKIADTDEELELLDVNEKLVVGENRLLDPADPNYISFAFGICSKKLFNGDLINRSQTEIDAQQEKFEADSELIKVRTIDEQFKVRTFDFDGRKFPLTAGARNVYQAVIETNPASVNLITSTGVYALQLANTPGFKEAYYAAILAINQEQIVS